MSDESNRDRITRNIRLAYGMVTDETIPERFQELLRQIEEGRNDDPDPDSGIAAEPPPRPKDGPKSSAAAVGPPQPAPGALD